MNHHHYTHTELLALVGREVHIPTSYFQQYARGKLIDVGKNGGTSVLYLSCAPERGFMYHPWVELVVLPMEEKPMLPSAEELARLYQSFLCEHYNGWGRFDSLSEDEAQETIAGIQFVIDRMLQALPDVAELKAKSDEWEDKARRMLSENLKLIERDMDASEKNKALVSKVKGLEAELATERENHTANVERLNWRIAELEEEAVSDLERWKNLNDDNIETVDRVVELEEEIRKTPKPIHPKDWHLLEIGEQVLMLCKVAEKDNGRKFDIALECLSGMDIGWMGEDLTIYTYPQSTDPEAQ